MIQVKNIIKISRSQIEFINESNRRFEKNELKNQVLIKKINNKKFSI